MSWLVRHRVRRFVKYSFWLFPSLAVVAAWLVGRGLIVFAPDLDLRIIGENNVDGARAVIGVFAASMLTFIVYTVSALLLAVQLASGQISPRLISLTFGRWSTKLATSAFVFSFVLALVALANVSANAGNDLVLVVAIVANVASIIVFFWFVEQLGTSLRPVSILQYLFIEGREAMDMVYGSDPVTDRPPRDDGITLPPPEKGRIVTRRSFSGTFLAFGRQDLVSLASRTDCVIELLPQVGDFISIDDPLARIYPANAEIDDETINSMVALGPERTMELDTTFALRIMVDICSRALSPAINDPTTAVLVLDQIHRLLRVAGLHNIDVGRVYDAGGKLRLVFPTPTWEDIVDLAVTEIRHYGAPSLQVARRTKAMLEHLIATLPPSRAAALQRELVAIENSVARSFPEIEDRRRGSTADLQGLGGSSRRL